MEPTVCVTEWQGSCQRCHKRSNSHIMSMYSTKLICFDCKDKEQQRIDYRNAVESDCDAAMRGLFNYPGIGEPIS
jgi:hypothetical protein